MSKILQTTGDELARLAGEMLQPKDGKLKCGDCERCMTIHCYYRPSRKNGEICCDFKSRHDIPIDWPNAMKWRDWAVEKYGRGFFFESVEVVYRNCTGKTAFFYYSLSTFMMFKATPTHIMQAVLLTVERGKE